MMLQVEGANLESTMQADNNNLEIGAAEEAQDAGEELGSVKKKLHGVGFVTLAMAVSTVLVHKPSAHGVFFQRHSVAYYLTLMVIFLAGVVEVWTAFWVSDGESGRSRRAFGRVVHCASVVPLAAVAGIGGYTVMVNMLS